MSTPQKTKRAFRDLEDVSKVLKGLVDEARVRAHLAAMELEGDAGPYLSAVSAASKAAARDLYQRGRMLNAELKRLHAAHRTSAATTAK